MVTLSDDGRRVVTAPAMRCAKTAASRERAIATIMVNVHSVRDAYLFQPAAASP